MFLNFRLVMQNLTNIRHIQKWQFWREKPARGALDRLNIWIASGNLCHSCYITGKKIRTILISDAKKQFKIVNRPKYLKYTA